MKRLYKIMVLMALVLAFGTFDIYAGGMGKTSGGAMMQQSSSESAPLAIPRASELIGLSVTNDQGEHLGKVGDFIVSNDGRIAYIVISSGGVLGFGEKLCAIPWRASNPRIQENSLVVSISQERFQSAPSFESWADFRESGFVDKVRAYYGEGTASELGTSMPMEKMPTEPSSLPDYF
jgi:hypothetical protein